MPVPTWKSHGRLMLFETLPKSSGMPVYTVAWRIKDDHSDTWSRRFLNFKDANEASVRGAAYVLKDAVSEILRLNSFKPDETGLTAALSSGDTQLVSGKPLERVCKWIAKQLDLHWLPDVFTKEAHRRLHDLSSSHERDAEVSGKYKVNKRPTVKNLVIVDDLVTRGATLGDMVRALRDAHCNVRVVGLALGKNESRDFASQYGVSVSNDHVPPEWDQLWKNPKK